MKTALTKLVPTSRTVNGKTLAEDVTLTAADIKMPDSEEDVGAAMAKRAVGTGVLGDEIDLNDIDTSGMYRVQKPKTDHMTMVSCLLYMAMVTPLLRCALTMLRTGAQYAVHVDSTGHPPKWEDWTASRFAPLPKYMNCRL